MSEEEIIQGLFWLGTLAVSFVVLWRSRTRGFRRKLARQKLSSRSSAGDRGPSVGTAAEAANNAAAQSQIAHR